MFLTERASFWLPLFSLRAPIAGVHGWSRGQIGRNHGGLLEQKAPSELHLVITESPRISSDAALSYKLLILLASPAGFEPVLSL
jgi:hypothetical protein